MKYKMYQYPRGVNEGGGYSIPMYARQSPAPPGRTTAF